MTSFPHSTEVLNGGIVLLDPQTSAVLRIIALQCNPASIVAWAHVQDSDMKKRLGQEKWTDYVPRDKRFCCVGDQRIHGFMSDQ